MERSSKVDRLCVAKQTLDRSRDIVAREADVPKLPVVHGLKLVDRPLALPATKASNDKSSKSGSRAATEVTGHDVLRNDRACTAGRRIALKLDDRRTETRPRGSGGVVLLACVTISYPEDSSLPPPGLVPDQQ